MVRYITLDSSVIVAALREQEEKHDVCKKLLERVKEGEFVALEPYTVLVEVVAAIKRRTRSKSLAERVKNGLKDIDTIKFSDLISSRADSAAELAKETGVRGMDAIVVQIAKEFKAPLVSLDGEMTKRAKMVVEIVNIEDMVNL